MPEFLIIAGPNGAGKSSFSADLSRAGALIFDPDKEKLAIERQYPGIFQEALEQAVTQRYFDFAERALDYSLHLTVETNLRNHFLADQAESFRARGYLTGLVFMLLPDFAASMDRVNLRVKQKGHYVDAESIKYNFRESLSNLKQVAPVFDQVMLVCAASQYGIITPPEPLLTIRAGTITRLNENIPAWAQTHVDEIIQITAPAQAAERKPWKSDDMDDQRYGLSR